MITVQIGQCGNQLGLELWTQLLSLSDPSLLPPALRPAFSSVAHWAAARDAFFNDDGTARVVVVDSEPKVVAAVAATFGRFARPAVLRSRPRPGPERGFVRPQRPGTAGRGGAAGDANSEYDHDGNREHGDGDNTASSSKSGANSSLSNNPPAAAAAAAAAAAYTILYKPGGHLLMPADTYGFGGGSGGSGAGIGGLGKSASASAMGHSRSPFANVVFEQCGRGNNWAMGYYGGAARLRNQGGGSRSNTNINKNAGDSDRPASRLDLDGQGEQVQHRNGCPLASQTSLITYDTTVTADKLKKSKGNGISPANATVGYCLDLEPPVLAPASFVTALAVAVSNNTTAAAVDDDPFYSVNAKFARGAITARPIVSGSVVLNSRGEPLYLLPDSATTAALAAAAAAAASPATAGARQGYSHSHDHGLSRTANQAAPAAAHDHSAFRSMLASEANDENPECARSAGDADAIAAVSSGGIKRVGTAKRGENRLLQQQLIATNTNQPNARPGKDGPAKCTCGGPGAPLAGHRYGVRGHTPQPNEQYLNVYYPATSRGRALPRPSAAAHGHQAGAGDGSAAVAHTEAFSTETGPTGRGAVGGLREDGGDGDGGDSNCGDELLQQHPGKRGGGERGAPVRSASLVAAAAAGATSAVFGPSSNTGASASYDSHGRSSYDRYRATRAARKDQAKRSSAYVAAPAAFHNAPVAAQPRFGSYSLPTETSLDSLYSDAVDPINPDADFVALALAASAAATAAVTAEGSGAAAATAAAAAALVSGDGAALWGDDIVHAALNARPRNSYGGGNPRVARTRTRSRATGSVFNSNNAGDGPDSDSGPLSRRALNAIRLQLERADPASPYSDAAGDARVSSLLLLHSTGGGTGSGLGSRLHEACRDHFGSKLRIVTGAVTPIMGTGAGEGGEAGNTGLGFGLGGEVILQYYNTVLSMQAVLGSSDAVWQCSNHDAMTLALSANNSNNANANVSAANAASMSTNSHSSLGAWGAVNRYFATSFIDFILPATTTSSAAYSNFASNTGGGGSVAVASLQSLAAQLASRSPVVTPNAQLDHWSSVFNVQNNNSAALAGIVSAAGHVSTSFKSHLDAMLSHLIPSPAAPLFEIWSTAGLAALTSQALTSQQGGVSGTLGRVLNGEWSGHCDAMSRLLPRTLPAYTAVSADMPPLSGDSASLSSFSSSSSSSSSKGLKQVGKGLFMTRRGDLVTSAPSVYNLARLGSSQDHQQQQQQQQQEQKTSLLAAQAVARASGAGGLWNSALDSYNAMTAHPASATMDEAGDPWRLRDAYGSSAFAAPSRLTNTGANTGAGSGFSRGVAVGMGGGRNRGRYYSNYGYADDGLASITPYYNTGSTPQVSKGVLSGSSWVSVGAGSAVNPDAGNIYAKTLAVAAICHGLSMPDVNASVSTGRGRTSSASASVHAAAAAAAGLAFAMRWHPSDPGAPIPVPLPAHWPLPQLQPTPGRPVHGHSAAARGFSVAYGQLASGRNAFLSPPDAATLQAALSRFCGYAPSAAAAGAGAGAVAAAANASVGAGGAAGGLLPGWHPAPLLLLGAPGPSLSAYRLRVDPTPNPSSSSSGSGAGAGAGAGLGYGGSGVTGSRLMRGPAVSLNSSGGVKGRRGGAVSISSSGGGGGGGGGEAGVISAAVAPDIGRSVTVGINRGRAALALLHSAHKAEAMLQRGAYMHWYQRYGCEQGDIVEAIETCRAAADAYAALLQ